MESIIKEKEPDYNQIRNILNKISVKYPFAALGSLGKTVYGREISYLRIGRAGSYVLYVGGVHGSERLTALLLLQFAQNLCEALQNGGKIAGVEVARAMYGRGLIIVPLLNPDGYEISLKGAAGCGQFAPRIRRLCGGHFDTWNANLRGVDLNHNFDADWHTLREKEKAAGILGPGPRQFGGHKPHSEPETVALVNLCEKVHIRHTLAFHSQGEVIYWNYGDKTPAKAQKMAEIMAASTGYAMDVPTGLALGGGFKDWFIQKTGRPGFTIEIGKGENPLDPLLLPQLYRRLAELLILSIVM